MNLEKIGYSLIGSLIAGSIIQKNLGMEQQYFLVISIGLVGVCSGVQWWNSKIEQKTRDQYASIKLESRDAMINKVIDAIVEANEKEIACIKEEIGRLKKSQGDLHSELRDNFQKVYDLIANTNYSIGILCDSEITKFEELIECYKGISSDLRPVQERFDKKLEEIIYINKKIMEDIASVPKTEVLLNDIIDLNKRNINDISQQNEKMVSTINTVFGDIMEAVEKVKNELVEDKNTIHDILEREQKTNLESFSELMNLLKFINNDINGKISEVYGGLYGIFSNIQSVLDETDSKLGNIQYTNGGMYGLLEDTKDKIFEIKEVIEDGSGRIEEAISQNMERQNEIVDEEQSVLESYDNLLKRINDEIIVKLINDSNNLLKCMKDCYLLLDSQRRVKR